VFSSWKGHRALCSPRPAGLRSTREPTISTISVRSSRDSMNSSGIRPATATPRSAGQSRANQPGDFAHVCTALQARLEQAHDLTHAAHVGGTGLRNRLIDDRSQLRFGKLLGQVGFENPDFSFFGFGQLGAIARAILLGRFPALLDHLLDQGQDLGIVGLGALVDLALLDRGSHHAQGLEAFLLAGTHRLLDVIVDLRFQRHERPNPALYWNQYSRLRFTRSRESLRRWRLTAAAFLRLRSWVGFS